MRSTNAFSVIRSAIGTSGGRTTVTTPRIRSDTERGPASITGSGVASRLLAATVLFKAGDIPVVAPASPLHGKVRALSGPLCTSGAESVQAPLPACRVTQHRCQHGSGCSPREHVMMKVLVIDVGGSHVKILAS